MSFLPECFTPARLDAMAQSMQIELGRLSGGVVPPLTQAQDILAGALGFGGWDQAQAQAKSQAFFAPAHTLHHPGLAWLAVPGNRKLLWGAMGMHVEQGISIDDSCGMLPQILLQWGAPPQVQEVLEQLRADMVRTNSVCLDVLSSAFDRQEAVNMAAQTRLGTLGKSLKRLSEEN